MLLPPPRACARVREKVLVDSFASNYKCIASSNKCLTGSNKKLVITILIKFFLLLLVRHLLLLAMHLFLAAPGLPLGGPRDRPGGASGPRPDPRDTGETPIRAPPAVFLGVHRAPPGRHRAWPVWGIPGRFEPIRTALFGPFRVKCELLGCLVRI